MTTTNEFTVHLNEPQLLTLIRALDADGADDATRIAGYITAAVVEQWITQAQVKA